MMSKKTSYQHLHRSQLDRTFTAPMKPADVPSFRRGYVREIRESLGITTTQLAKFLGISQPAVVKLEKAERDGAISLKSLKKVAEVLNCKLVYSLVPKTSLDGFLHERAKEVAERQVLKVGHSMTLEDQGTSKAELARQIRQAADEMIRNLDRRLWESP